MKTFAQISYNIHCNFTNYGSALQSWALSQVIKSLGHKPVLVDYCPDCLKDKDPLNPMKNMWDTDVESRKMCELSLPAIRINYAKFEKFYTEHFNRTHKVYTRENFNDIVDDEGIDGFVCGSIPLTTGIAQALHIQRVSAENAADGIGDQGFDLPLQLCPADCDVPLFYLRRQFILKTIDFNKNPVQFFFVCFQLVEASLTLGFPFFEFICN